MKTSAVEHSQTYTVYVTLTSVSRAWRRTVIGQPWFHATPTQHLCASEGQCRDFMQQKFVYVSQKKMRVTNVCSWYTNWTKLTWPDLARSDFKFSVGDSLELSGIQFTPPKRTRHRQDSFVVSGVAVWISFYTTRQRDNLIGCSEIRSVGAQPVLNTCIPISNAAVPAGVRELK